MRLCILDPGLHSRAGHHLEWNLRLVRELAGRGHEIRVYANNCVDAVAGNILSPYATVTPLFRISPYQIPALYEQQAVTGIPFLDTLAGPLAHFLDGAQILAEDLGAVEACDMWIWPTLSSHQLYAITLDARRLPNACCIHVDPGFEAPAGAGFWRYAWLAAMRAGLNIRLGVVNPELEALYAPILEPGNVQVWPTCVDGIRPHMPRTRPRRIGFFGEQRNEKGAGLFGQLVSRLLSEGWEVVVQDSGTLVRGDNAGNLISLGYVEDIVAEISKCDLIVAPYHPVSYRYRSSGIVWEALACGVPVVVPKDTPSARLATSMGAGREFASFSVEDIHGAIRAVVADYADIALRAHAASMAWPLSRGVKRFADAIIGQHDATTK